MTTTKTSKTEAPASPFAVALARVRAKTLRPPPKLDLVEWADKYRFLSREASSTGGRWDTERVAIARGPMKATTEPGVHILSVMACTQLAKALDVTTPIPTPDGWTTMGELSVGDQLFDEAGAVCRVIKATEVYTDRACYRVVFSDGEEVICDAGHLWSVDDNLDRNTTQVTRVAETWELAETQKNKFGRNRYAIPVAAPLQLPPADLPVRPYVLGAWLGDGTTASSGITLHESDGEIFDHLLADGVTHRVDNRTETGVLSAVLNFTSISDRVCSRGHSKVEFGGTNKAGARICRRCSSQAVMLSRDGKPRDPVLETQVSLGMKLRALGICGKAAEKRIPPEYLRASEEQRLELLQGLMDTDGTVDKKGSNVSFTCSMRGLAEDCLELVRSLGFKPTLYSGKAYCTYNDARREGDFFKVSFTAYSDRPVFKLVRKAERLKSQHGCRVSETRRRRIVLIEEVPSRAVRCIGVDSPNHLFLCGRGMIPTHNTELILNIVGYHMHLDPSPMLCVYPTESSAETWSKDRLAPMLRDSPALRGIVDDRARASGNTILHKSFPGGQISMVGANSPTELAQRPIRLVLADEIDKFPASAGSEGDPLSLAEERAATFPTSYLFVRVCSPTIKGASRIETSWLESDMRRPYVPCPHCAHEQVLTWKHVQWSKDADGQHLTDTAAIYCDNCGAGWSEPERLDALPLVQWRQTRKFKCCDVDQDPMTTRAWRWDAENEIGRAICTECGKDAVSNEHAGFHINKMYSPWEPLSKLAAKFVLSKNDPERLKTFINTQLAETFEEVATETVGDEALLARRESYAAAVPQGVGLLTAGVDTQDNRLECEIVGWGQDEESWGIDYKIFPGDPALPDVWQDLDDYLQTRWTREDGRTMTVEAASVDTQGHHSQAAYSFCRKLIGRRVWAIQGKSDQTGKRSPVWPRKPSLKNKGRVPLYSVGTQAAKDMIFRRLALTEPGPGYTHFPATYDGEYFAQLTVEKPRPKMVGGNKFYVWECPNGKRNEALDCRVYAYAALCGLQAAGLQLNKRVAEMAGTFQPAKPKPPPVPQATAAPAVELENAPPRAIVVESSEPVRSRKSSRRPTQGFRDNVW